MQSAKSQCTTHYPSGRTFRASPLPFRTNLQGEPTTRFRGVSLIEVLLVITILGILATIGFATYNHFQKAARDSRRKTDLHNIQIGMKMYYDNKGHYPFFNVINLTGSLRLGCEDGPHTLITPPNPWTCTDTDIGVPVEYMKVFPGDPIPWIVGVRTYNYMYAQFVLDLNAQTYRYYACLENLNDSQAKTQGGIPGGAIRRPDDVPIATIACPANRIPYYVDGM